MRVTHGVAIYAAALIVLIGGTALLMSREEMPARLPGDATSPSLAAPSPDHAAPSEPSPAPAPVEREPSVAREVVDETELPGVSGRIEDGDQQPIAGAKIDWHGATVASAVSDARGEFRILVSEPVPGDLAVAHPDFAGVIVKRVRAGQRRVISLERGEIARGVVREQGSGTPIADALVVISPKDALARWTHSDSQGRFAVDHIPAGNGFIVCLAMGWEDYSDHLDLPRELDIALPRGADRSGHVVDGHTGAPIAGATIACEMRRQLQVWFVAAPPAMPAISVTTDGDGKFWFQQIGLRACTLRVKAAGYQPRLLAEREAEVRLFRPLTLAGTVVDASGNGIAGATVMRLSSRWGNWDVKESATSNATGAYAFRDLDPYGTLVFGARHPDWAPLVHEPLSLPVADAAMRFAMTPAAHIRGMLRRADGAPVSGVNVVAQPRFHDEQSGAGAPRVEKLDQLRRLMTLGATTDDAGKFELHGLMPGKYVVGCVDSEPWITRSVDALAGQTAEVILDLPQAGIIEGVCLGSDGKPITHASVQALLADAQTSRPTTTDDDGHFEFRCFDVGSSVQLTATSFRHARTRMSVTTPVTGLVIRLVPPQTLRGRITSRALGKPLERFSVTSEPSDAHLPLADHADGTFELRGLAEQSYRVKIAAPAHRSATIDAMVSNASPPIEVVLEPCSIWGQVRHLGGAPAADIDLLLINSASSAVLATMITDSNGWFGFDLPGHTARVAAGLQLAVGNREKPFVPIIAIDDGTPQPLHIELPPPATLSLAVTSSLGAVDHGRVTFSRRGASRTGAKTVPIPIDGRVRIEGLYPGTYQVRVEASGFAPNAAEIGIDGSGVHEHSIAMMR